MMNKWVPNVYAFNLVGLGQLAIRLGPLGILLRGHRFESCKVTVIYLVVLLARGISQGAHKLVRTPMVNKKKLCAFNLG